MHIWLINPYGPIPSEAWRTYCFPLIAEALAAEGHEVIWWTSNFAHHFKKFRSEGWFDIEVSKSFRIRLVPTTGYSKNISLGRIFRDAIFAMRTYRRGLIEQRPDLIIYSESPLTFGYAGQRLADHHRCPAIYHQMDLWPELIVEAAPPRLRSIVKAALWPVFAIRSRTYSRLSAATALAKPYLEAVFDVVPEMRDKPSAIIYNGIDVEAFRSMMHSSEVPTSRFPDKKTNDVWAVFAGSLGPSYDIGVMCEVARSLAVMDSKIHIIIAGDGPLRSLVEATASGELGPANLYYVGQLTPVELAALYSLCDIGLCAYSASSNVEMPDKIYDYTAAGLPVLVSLSGEVARVVAEERIGLHYEPGSTSDLLSKLHALVFDADALYLMSKESRRLGLQFNKKVQYSKFIDVVNTLTGCAKAVPEHDSIEKMASKVGG